MDILEEDDPVVKEIPVYLSKTLEDKLFIVQYPAHSRDVWTNNINISNTFIKPENQQIRVELAMDSANELSYDRLMGEQLTLKKDGKSTGNDDESEFERSLMDKAVLTSERAVPDCSNLAVGIFQDGKLYITPLKAMLHMKLKCEYLDESEKHAREGEKGEDDDDDEDNAKPVKVTFARRVPDNQKKQQEQSFQHHAKKSEEELWIRTNYVSDSDSLTDHQDRILFETRSEITSCTEEDSENTLNLDTKDFIHRLVPQLPDEGYLQATTEDQIDLHYLKTLPIDKRIKAFMKKVRVTSFAKLCKMILVKRDEMAQREMLKHVQEVAMLVQGNWVVKSGEIYKTKPIPENSSRDKENLAFDNSSNDFMCKARDYILSSFNNTEQQFLNSNTILSGLKLTPKENEEIFSEFLIHEPEKGWRLKEPFDSKFCESHRDIVDRQKILWKGKREHLLETMEAQNQPPQRQRRKSNRESLGSENEERNVGRGRKTVKELSLSDNNGAISEPVKHKKSRSRKISETTT